MKTPIPMPKVELIERSLRCFWLGCIGLIPVVGFPFAIAAAWQSYKVRKGQRGQWNPARRLYLVGMSFAQIGLWLFGVVPLALVTVVAMYGPF